MRRCLKIVEKGETEILVMSDLKDEGYGMMDRLEGLNEEATLLVLDRVAKFHASSVAYKEQYGELAPLLMRKVMPKNACDMTIKYTLPKVEVLAKAAEKWGMDKELVQAIRKWGDNMYSETVKVMDPETAPEDFQVLCHGDLWLNNMMFKTEDTKTVEDVILVRMRRGRVLQWLNNQISFRLTSNCLIGIAPKEISSTSSPAPSSLK